MSFPRFPLSFPALPLVPLILFVLFVSVASLHFISEEDHSGSSIMSSGDALNASSMDLMEASQQPRDEDNGGRRTAAAAAAAGGDSEELLGNTASLLGKGQDRGSIFTDFPVM